MGRTGCMEDPQNFSIKYAVLLPYGKWLLHFQEVLRADLHLSQHFSVFLPSSYFHLCDGCTAACSCFMSRVLPGCQAQVQREIWEQASRTLSKSTAQRTATDAWRQALRITQRETLTFLKFPHSKVEGQFAWVCSLLPSCGQSPRTLTQAIRWVSASWWLPFSPEPSLQPTCSNFFFLSE